MMREPWEDVLAGKAPAAVPVAGRVPGAPVSFVTKPEDPRLPYEAPAAQANLEHTRLVNAKMKREAAAAAEAEKPIVPLGGAGGIAHLQSLDPTRRNVVQSVLDGRVKLPVSTRKDPYWRGILQDVVTVDPSYDQTDFAARQRARMDAGPGGKLGGRLANAATALVHGAELQDAIRGLDNYSGVLGAKVVNPIRNSIRSGSDPAIRTFEDVLDKYSKEGAKFLIPTGSGTKEERGESKTLIGLNDAPGSQNAVLKKDAVLYMEAFRQLDFSLKQQLGPTARIQDFLSPEALAAYRKLTAPDGAFHDEVARSGDPLGLAGGAGGARGAPGGGYSPGGGSLPGSPPRHGEGGLQGIFNAYGDSPVLKGVAQGAGPLGLGASERRVFDPMTSSQVDAMIRAGRPPAEINSFLAGQGTDQIPEASILAAQRYHQQHPDYRGRFAEATKSLPTTMAQRISGSAIGAGVVGSADAMTAGMMDELGGAGSALLGGDYTKTRDLINARKEALAATHPTANLAGNVAGGLAATLLGNAAVARVAPGIAGALGKAAPAVGDAAYGAIYGAGENNDDRLGGAVLGGATAAGAGMATRGTIRGLASVVAPTGGEMAPLYAEGVYPTLGQRMASKGFPGRAINTFEQAMQSIPLAGGLPARARGIARDQFQLGAFNHALRDIGEALPEGMQPGTDPHVYARDAFNRAYDAARSGMQFVPDQPYLVDLHGFKTQLGNATLNQAQAKQVADRIQMAVGSRLRAGNGALSGDAYKAAASDLADTARAWSKTEPLQASALNDYITMFDNAARRNSSPDAVAALDAADKGYAKLVRIQDAAAARGGDSGTFSPTQFDGSVQRNSGGVRSSAYNQGDALMQDYASAGKNLVDTLGNSGSAERLMTGQAVGGVGGLGGASLGLPLAALAKPGALALSPYVPGMNALVTRAMAPRTAILPPNLAAGVNNLGVEINNRAPIAGRLAVPAALGWEFGQ